MTTRPLSTTPDDGSRHVTTDTAAATRQIDRGDIQAGILHGLRGSSRAHVFLEVDDPCAARTWLGEAAGFVTVDADHPAPAVSVNVAITFAGLRALGMPQHRLATLPEPFRQGMAARADLIGDTGTNHPTSWEAPFRFHDPLHIVVILDGDHDALTQRVEELRDGLWQDGLVELCPALWGHRLPQDREHFGYVDGLSQPPIEGVPGARCPSSPGQGRLRGTTWEAVPAGEFVLGLPDSDGMRDRTLPALTTNGSYLVLRKLAQDVAAHRSLVRATAERAGISTELAAAKIMGRWPDGRPLTLQESTRPGTCATSDPMDPTDHPTAGSSDRMPSGGPDRVYTDDPRRGYTYDGDDGTGCPVGSHVRRANPRGSLGFGGRLEHRHRLLRRGIPYGPPYRVDEAGAEADQADRGLIFACYQSDLAMAFEFVQSTWLLDGDTFGLGDDQDPVLGTDGGAFRLGGAAPVRLDGQPTVRVRGGAYLLMPGGRGLHHLSTLPDPAAPAAQETSDDQSDPRLHPQPRRRPGAAR